MSDEINTLHESQEPKKRRGGRRPMTAEEKEAAAQVRAAEKAKADNLKPTYVLQYQETEISLDDLAEAAKAEFHMEKKRTRITELEIYVKPEEHAAYYVVNGMFSGKLDI